MTDHDKLLTKWNFEALASSDNDPGLEDKYQASKLAVKEFSDKWKSRTDYLEDAAVLKSALDDFERLERYHGCNAGPSYYFSLRQAQNQTDDSIKSKSRLADEKAIELYNQLQFFTLSLAKIGPDQQALFLSSAELSNYRYFLQQIFAEQKYVLSEAEEQIINLLSQPAARSWIDMTETFLANESKETLTDQGRQVQNLPQLMALINHKQKPIRDEAASHVDQIMAEQAKVATEEMNALLSYKKVIDQVRGFDRPDAARHLSDGVDTAMVDALMEAVSSRNDIANDYYQLKATLMGLPRLAYHERNVEYGDIAGSYSYAESVELVSRVLGSLDAQFKDIVMDFVVKGQVDAFPSPGKSGGAFCAGNLLTQPTYIMLNHTDRLQDVLTMAHEFGHGINNELSRVKQHSLNFGTSLATAEVASTFMEDFVLEELLKQADDHTRLAILMMKLNDDVSSIFRQVACYRFEQALHQAYRQSGYLSCQTIGQIFKEYMSEYMGPAVEHPQAAENWWVYWSHIRNSFYVYSYASGLLISKSLQNMVHKEPASVNKVKQFLEAGTSDSPSAIFDSIGISINQTSFWQAGINQIEELLTETKSLAKKLALI